MKTLHISVATGIRGNATNRTYSTQAEITSLEALKEAVQYDHVAGMFRNNERSNENFQSTDCVMMDCDNEKSDNAGEWLSPEKLHERMSDVAFAVIFSKSHMLDKKDKTARPRFHVYFPLKDTITEAGHVARLKECLLKVIPEFDRQAKDAARFFFGVSKAQGIVYEGMKCVDEVIPLTEAQEETPSSHVDMAESPRKVSTPQEVHTRPYSQTNNADIARVIRQFETFIYESGVRPLYPLTIIPDGQLHKFATQEDPSSKKHSHNKAGSYRLYIEGYPVGYVKDFRKGIEREFRYDFSPEERREYGRRNAQQRAQDDEKRREDERKKEQAKRLQAEREKQAREMALAEYRNASDEDGIIFFMNNYMWERFMLTGITFPDKWLYPERFKYSLFQRNYNPARKEENRYPLKLCTRTIPGGCCEEGMLLVPMIDVITNDFRTLIRVMPEHNESGKYDRKNYPGISPQGAAFILALNDIDDADILCVCEGFCTGLALLIDTRGKYPIFSVGACENLYPVCKALQKKYSKRVIITADNDNAGIEAAERCKKAGFAHGIRIPHVHGGDWYDEILAKKGKQAC